MPNSWGEKLEESIATLTLGVGLLALFYGVENWWLVFVVGWLVLTPLADIFLDGDTADPTPGVDGEPTDQHEAETDAGDALDTLRDRYARGELTEAEFERKVERLLETETVADARERVGDGRRVAGGTGHEAERAAEGESGR